MFMSLTTDLLCVAVHMFSSALWTRVVRHTFSKAFIKSGALEDNNDACGELKDVLLLYCLPSSCVFALSCLHLLAHAVAVAGASSVL